MKQPPLTRKELYDLLWSEPISVILTQCNLSYHDLREICKTFNIPTPQMGYWGKLKFGKPLQTTPLPDWEGEEPLITLISKKSQKTVAVETTKSSEKKKELVSKKLSKPHSHTKSALAILSKNGFRKNWSGDVRRSGYQSLDITVSPENIRRAIRFMDAFIKLVEERGFRFTVGSFKTCVIISDQELRIRLREKLSRVIIKEKGDRTEYHPNGKLALVLEGWYKKIWTDGKRQLEEQLSDILTYLELEGVKRRTEQEQREKRWEEERRIKKQKEDLLQRKKEELSRFKKLLLQSERWHKAIILQDFISEMEKKSIRNQTEPEEFKSWLSWACKKSDWYNPFIESEDELLADVDRDGIILKSEILKS